MLSDLATVRITICGVLTRIFFSISKVCHRKSPGQDGLQASEI